MLKMLSLLLVITKLECVRVVHDENLTCNDEVCYFNQVNNKLYIFCSFLSTRINLIDKLQVHRQYIFKDRITGYYRISHSIVPHLRGKWASGRMIVMEEVTEPSYWKRSIFVKI